MLCIIKDKKEFCQLNYDTVSHLKFLGDSWSHESLMSFISSEGFSRAPDSFRCISWLSIYQAELFKLDLSYESPGSLVKM